MPRATDAALGLAPSHKQALSYDRDFDVTIGQYVVSDRNLACAILIRHETLPEGEVSLFASLATLYPTVVRQCLMVNQSGPSLDPRQAARAL